MRAPFTEKCDAGGFLLPASLPASSRPTAAIIDVAALEHNFKKAAALAAGCKLLAVVKANAYGHGAVEVSRRLLAYGADMLGVALLEEGVELREAGIDAPILIMGVIFPEQSDAAVTMKLTPTVFTRSIAEALSDAARKRSTRIPVHVKIDTGMGRIGISSADAFGFVRDLRKLDGIDVQGLMTHFADADLQDKKFAAAQMDRFESLQVALTAAGISVPLCHAANSAAVIDFKRARFTMVRPGLMLYGYDPLEAATNTTGLKPVLSLVTRIAFIKRVSAGLPVSYGRTFVTQRDSTIATLPLGYADGFNRGLSNKGEALVRGKRVPIVGRVCMDMCMIDVTDVDGVSEGDAVVLLGSQGSERITADDIAAKTGTIAYEVLCGISSRVPRIYQ